MISKRSYIPDKCQWLFNSLAQVFPPKQKPVPTKWLKRVVNSKSNCNWKKYDQQKAKSWRLVFTGLVNEFKRVNEDTQKNPTYQCSQHDGKKTNSSIKCNPKNQNYRQYDLPYKLKKFAHNRRISPIQLPIRIVWLTNGPQGIAVMPIPWPFSAAPVAELVPTLTSHMVAGLCFLYYNLTSTTFSVSVFGIKIVYLVVCAFSWVFQVHALFAKLLIT